MQSTATTTERAVSKLFSRPKRVEAPRGIPGSDAYTELYGLLHDATHFLHQRFERHGRVFRTRLVYPVVFMIGEEANKSILVTRRSEVSFGLGYAQTAVKRVFEGSIMLQDGAAHDTMRDVLSPAVGKLALRESCDGIARIWASAAERLGDTAAFACGRDVYTITQRATFEVAANVLTGLELGAETEAFRPYFERLADGFMAATTVRVPLGKLDRALRARRKLEELLAPRVLAARTKPPAGLLGQLAHYRRADGSLIPVDAIVGHLLLLFWAGYDTTASAGAWALHVLAQRIDWQERLRAELQATVGADGGAIDDGRELPQMGWFLYELERMYPSALFFPRIATQDIEFGGYRIPEGTPVFYSPYMSHRDPATFESPDAFDPERWSPERGARRAVAGKLVGFGGGPRICLGKSFAKLQLKIMLHAILSRYRLEPDPLSRPSVMKLPVHHPIDSLVRFRT